MNKEMPRVRSTLWYLTILFPLLRPPSPISGFSASTTPLKVFVCTDTQCEVDGAFDTIAQLESRGIEPCEMGCPGCCGRGPIVQIDDGNDYESYEEVKPDSDILELIVSIAEGSVARRA